MSKISVIVPVYKVEKYINRCINSILKQSFDDFELLLVDDGSPDNCGEICDQYQKNDKRVRVFHQKNQGQSAARNTALNWLFKESDSEWITFIDSDDWVHKDYLKILYEGAIECDADICQCRMIETEITLADDKLGESECEKVSAESALYKEGRFEIDGYAWGKLYKRNLFEDVRFPVGMIFEDFYLIPEIVLKASTIAETKYKLYYYFQRSDSTVWSRDMRYIENKWVGYEKLIPLFMENKEYRLAEIMKNAYVFWTQSLMETTSDKNQREAILKKGREIIKRYPEISGYPFHLNHDILFSFYPVAGAIYKTGSKIKKLIRKDSK